jgi:formylglycine-generating enzyme required for sulfatase activity
MGGGWMIRLAWVLGVSGLAGVLASPRGMDEAVEPPGTATQPPRSAGEPPKSVAKTPKKSTERSRKAAKRAKRITNSIGMHFMLVPAGEFLMGSPAWDRDGEPDERPQRRVRITSPFFLGIYEVTQREYQLVIGANPSSEQLSPQQPVEMVSWFDAVQFCNRLSARENLPAYYEISGETVTIRGDNGYRLPTEAEWEYACRAGSTTKWSFGDDVQQLGLYAWFKGNSGSNSHPVGEKAPNAFGLYDMHGHMWEWCWDRYEKDYYQHGPADNPQGPSSGSVRVQRGGDGWNNDPPRLRSAHRNHQLPSLRFRDLGFRVARTSSEGPPAQAVAESEKEDSPSQILKKRGLERQRGTPSTWILKDEAAVLYRFRFVRDQETRLAWGRVQQRQLTAGGQTRQASIAACQARIDALDSEITQFDQKIAELGPSIGNATTDHYHNLLVQQRNDMVAEQRRLSRMINSFHQEGGGFEDQLRQFGTEVENMETSQRKAVEELRDSVAEINTRYGGLGADEEIAKALSDLFAVIKVEQRLGPSKELKDVTKAVARAAGRNRAGTATEKGRKPN